MKTLAIALLGISLTSVAGPKDPKIILQPYGTNQMLLIITTPGIIEKKDSRSTGDTNWNFFFSCTYVPNYVIIPKDTQEGVVLYRWIDSK